MPPAQPSRSPQLLVVIGCAVVLLAPALDTFLRLDPTPKPIENRRLSTMPRAPGDLAAVCAWPSRFDSWFADHFGLRSTLVETNARVKLQLLGVSPNPDRPVLVGRDGWLYFTESFELEDVLRKKPFTPAELDLWCSALEAQRRWLESRGIRFLFILVPNKSTIYPENLPAWVVTPNRPSRADQLLEALRSRTAVEVLDLRGPLLEAKQRMPVYSSTETHWNPPGGHIAYTEIMNRLQLWFSEVHPLPREDFAEIPRRELGAGLAKMLDAQRFLREDKVWLRPRRPLQARRVDASEYEPKERGRGRPVVTERQGGQIRRVVMLGDSFMVSLQTLLPEHFDRAVFLWWSQQEGFPAAVIEKERPDVVIVELVERLLSEYEPEAPSPAPAQALE